MDYLHRSLAQALVGPGLVGLVERLDEPRHDPLPDDFRAVLCEVLAGRLRGILRNRDDHVGRGIPRARDCRGENRGRVAGTSLQSSLSGALLGRPVALARTVAVAVAV